MRNCLLLFAFVLICGAASANHTLPSFVQKRAAHPLPFKTKILKSFTGAYLDDANAYESMISKPSTSTWSALNYSALTSGSGGTISATSETGTPYNITWSVVGTTFYWSLSVVPATGVDMDIHDFIVNRYTTNYDEDTPVSETYEVGGYGNSPWYSSGSIDLTTPDLYQLEIFFQCFTNDGVECTYDGFIYFY